MKSRVAAATAASAVILAEHGALGPALSGAERILLVLIAVVVVPAVFMPKYREAALEVLRILLGRRRG
jgi:hypothetical protein